MKPFSNGSSLALRLIIGLLGLWTGWHMVERPKPNTPPDNNSPKPPPPLTISAKLASTAPNDFLTHFYSRSAHWSFLEITELQREMRHWPLEKVRQVALAWANHPFENSFREAESFFLPTLINRWLELDPSGPRELIKCMRPLNSHSHTIGNMVLKPRAEQDPQAAVDWVIKSLNAEHAGLAFDTLTAAIAQKDPKQALALNAWAPQGFDSNQPLGEIAKAWAKLDLASCFDWAMHMSENEHKASALHALFDGLIESKNMNQAADLLNHIADPKQQAQAITLLCHKWGAKDPKSAWEWTARFDDTAIRLQAQGALITQLAGTDPSLSKATQLLDSITDQTEKLALLQQASLVATSSGTRNTTAVWALVKKFGLDSVHPEAVEELLRWGMTAPEPELLIPLVLKSESTKLQSNLSAALRHVTKKDGRKALELALNLEEPLLRSPATDSVMLAWVQRDFSEAMTTVREMGNQELIIQGLTSLARTRPNRVSEWLKPEDLSLPKVDSAIRTAVKKWSAEQPQFAARWAESLPPEHRQTYTDIVYANWVKSSPRDADTWLKALKSHK